MPGQECGITFHRREARSEHRNQKAGFRFQRHINITHEVCENCLECTKATGCPGLTFADVLRDEGSDRFVLVRGGHGLRQNQAAHPSRSSLLENAPSSRLAAIDLDHIASRVKGILADAWYAYLAGVGGMGIGVSTATLVRAGYREDIAFFSATRESRSEMAGFTRRSLIFETEKSHPTSFPMAGEFDCWH